MGSIVVQILVEAVFVLGDRSPAAVAPVENAAGTNGVDTPVCVSGAVVSVYVFNSELEAPI